MAAPGQASPHRSKPRRHRSRSRPAVRSTPLARFWRPGRPRGPPAVETTPWTWPQDGRAGPGTRARRRGRRAWIAAARRGAISGGASGMSPRNTSTPGQAAGKAAGPRAARPTGPRRSARPWTTRRRSAATPLGQVPRRRHGLGVRAPVTSTTACTGAARAAPRAPSNRTPPRQGDSSLRPPKREPSPAARTRAQSSLKPAPGRRARRAGPPRPPGSGWPRR